MNITITPHKLNGIVKAIPSKSQAHRLLICAAFSDRDTEIICPFYSQDIEATADCLNALGAHIQKTDTGFLVHPVQEIPQTAQLYCRESGSTLRFMLPICGALGVKTTFHMEGRLSERPLSPLWEEMERMGCTLSKADTLQLSGKLTAGTYRIRGDVSSQFITGLLFAAALLPGESQLQIIGKLESAPYVELTKDVLSMFSVSAENNRIHGCFPFHSPGQVTVEGDWSNAAFFLCANSLHNQVTVTNLNEKSCQGDRQAAEILPHLHNFVTIACENIPDLVPILAVTAAAAKGAEFTGVSRLRIKESDRILAIENMLQNFGCKTVSTENTLTVFPALFQSCTVDAVNDHRIAMAAAIASTVASGPVTVLGAECVRKSYPDFWEQFSALGGQYEQSLR